MTLTCNRPLTAGRLLGATATLLLAALVGGCGDSDPSKSEGTPDEPDLAAGEQTYMDFCGSCHGRDFEGSSQGPSQLDEHFAPGETTDAEFRQAIENGAPREYYDFTPMPAIGSLDDQEVTNVIAYIRSVQQERGFNPQP
ncbi:MAG: cytochrome c [Actinomycetia bacterium]|nr:cytochrome c [Actinomycetes bacterium]